MIGELIPDDLERRIRRDLARGHRLVWIAWGLALASLGSGLVSIRQAALLEAVDRHLLATRETVELGQAFDALQTVEIALIALGALLGARWLRGMLPVLEELRARGVIDGPPAWSGPARLSLLWRAAGVPADRAGWADVRVSDGRRGAVLAQLTLALAALVGVVGTVGLQLATDAPSARAWHLVLGVAGGLWLVAWILAGAAIDAARWREAVAARALGVFIPLVDSPAPTIARLGPPVLLLAAGVFVVNARPDHGPLPCPRTGFECAAMLVPVDHDHPASDTLSIVYGVHRAVGAPRGTLAIAVGGPGGSGLDESVLRLVDLDQDLVRTYDILFWDQRGIGGSDGKDCPASGVAYAITDATAKSAEAFVDACLREASVAPADVARYSTHQAADDLESIRDRLGLPTFALYGESYGTELAQTYAAAHPDRVSVLILDGAVDLTLSSNQFWAAAAKGFQRTLEDSLAACDADPACRADLPDAAAEFDRAMASFAGPVSVAYADSDGVVRDHLIDARAIGAAVGQLLYEPAGRAMILRAVAAADRGDNVPMARLIQVLGSGEGPGISVFAYHAIGCADYRVSPTADPHDIAAVEAFARANGIAGLRTEDVYRSQLPCLWWPYQPPTGDRPSPITSTPFPVFVLGATDDPITPVEQARAIGARLTDGYLITTRGGPHVTFGRGETCVDGPIIAYLLDGRRPTSRTIDCGGEVVLGYVGLTPADVSGYDTALTAMTSTRDEVFADPEVLLWNGTDELRVGCRDGGYFTLGDLTTADNLRFSGCQFVDGLPLTGTGSFDPASDEIHWSVTFPDGDLSFDAVGASTHVEGHWRGQAIEESR